MLGLPAYNAALDVEAVGFEIRHGRFSGVLITPWCMNLVVLPGPDDDWQGLPSGTAVELEFPMGRYTCMVSRPDQIPAHLSLPLFTSVQAFDNQDTARQVASEVLLTIHTPGGGTPAAHESSGDCRAQRKMSRRELLLGLRSIA